MKFHLLSFLLTMRYYPTPTNGFAGQLGPQHQRHGDFEKATISTERSSYDAQKSSIMIDNKPFEITWQKEVADQLRDQLNRKHKKEDSDDSPLMVSLVGIPGSGKSTSCNILKELLSDVGFMVLPFDGYHYPLDYLKELPNSKEMIYRRGAPDTFDVPALKRDLERIKYGSEPIVKLPDFNHEIADPEDDAHTFDREHTNIVLCEGLYLLHDEHGFEEVKNLFDTSIYMDANVDDCVGRLKVRNKCIPGYTPEEIEIRCEEVDRVNALTVEKSKKHAHFVVDTCPVY